MSEIVSVKYNVQGKVAGTTSWLLLAPSLGMEQQQAQDLFNRMSSEDVGRYDYRIVKITTEVVE